MKKSCSCVWTGTVDSSSDYHSISTERKQFSHTSDIAGVPTAKKRKKVIAKEMEKCNHTQFDPFHERSGG